MGIREKIQTFVELKLLQVGEVCDFEGIKISDLNEDEVNFQASIVASLEYIKQLDTRRFSRVKSEIDWLMNTNLVPKTGGHYRRRNKVCVLNFESYCEDERLVRLFFSGLIIHEATHGFLESKGFGYDIDNRVQIERICTAEENRFFKKAERKFPKYRGLLARDFTPEDWHEDWNTPKSTYLFRTIKRVING